MLYHEAADGVPPVPDAGLHQQRSGPASQTHRGRLPRTEQSSESTAAAPAAVADLQHQIDISLKLIGDISGSNRAATSSNFVHNSRNSGIAALSAVSIVRAAA